MTGPTTAMFPLPPRGPICWGAYSWALGQSWEMDALPVSIVVILPLSKEKIVRKCNKQGTNTHTNISLSFSGHGICGIGRFSMRSLAATCTFTGFSMLTTYLTSPLRTWATLTDFLRRTGIPSVSPVGGGLFTSGLVLAALIAPALNTQNRSKDQKEAANEDRKSIGAALSGAMAAAGLAISGMAKSSKVHDFLCISGLGQETYDPTLMAVMGSGILSSWLAYQFVRGWSMIAPKEKTLSCPYALGEGGKFGVPTNTVIDSQLLLGAATFGFGWGLTGVCPGPAIFAAASGNANACLLWFPGFIAGSRVGAEVKNAWNSKTKSA